MKNKIKPLVAALLIAGLCGGAQAAYFERVDYLGSGGYSTTTLGNSLYQAVSDLSPLSGDVALFGADTFVNLSTVNSTLDSSYAADAFLSFSAASTDLSMTLSQSLSATVSEGVNVASHQQDAFIDLTEVKLRIVGESGESMGSAVQVSFAGMASALYDFNSLVSSGYLGLGLSVSRGNTVLGEYLWDVQQTGDQGVHFSFLGNVGEELTFSSYMLSGASLLNVDFSPNVTPYSLVDTGAGLSGSFTIAAVPEPETYGMLMAGLGLMGFIARRRKVA